MSYTGSEGNLRDEEWAALDDFEDATEVSASAPLVDFGNTPAEQTAETRETDMSTMPETRNAALEVLRREVEDRRGRRLPRDGSAPLRRSATSQGRRGDGGCTGTPCATPTSCDEYGCKNPAREAREALPPRRPEESRSQSSKPLDLSVAVKADGGKTRYELISPHFKRALAEVLTFGAVKYADHNWRKGFLWSRLMGAAERHMEAIKRGELRDPESGLLHTAHWGFCVMALHDHIEFGMGENDLPWADRAAK